MIELCEYSDQLHAEKYRGRNESFEQFVYRVAGALSDSQEHYHQLVDIIGEGRFLPAGRVQASAGSPKEVTGNNCNVCGTIKDSLDHKGGILDNHWESIITMKYGAGIGMNFSTIRPRGDNIVTLDSKASGPVSYMSMWDAGCMTIKSAGHRRGAMMAVLNIDHPDILEFIRCKENRDQLTCFNISIGMTDDFMKALEEDSYFNLKFKGKTYERVKARPLWDLVMQNAYDWSEPGILFLDTINRMNNLWYCEKIMATNPCGEQPLPPYGSCLLGSFNLVQYLDQMNPDYPSLNDRYKLDLQKLRNDVYPVVRAYDLLIDKMHYPIPAQKDDAVEKRRMGLGLTGVANAIEALGVDFSYGSSGFLEALTSVMIVLKRASYDASVELAKEKGPFLRYDKTKYMQSGFIESLEEDTRTPIELSGVRNSHLLSIAPTGTISICANNVSSGIEPVLYYECDRTIQTFDGSSIARVEDYGKKYLGVNGKLAKDVTIDEHLAVQEIAQKYCDSAVSKTINFRPSQHSDDFYSTTFKDIYLKAWKMGLKGITVHNEEGKRAGIFTEVKPEESVACGIDPKTGRGGCE